jgi:hypothetical protein
MIDDEISQHNKSFNIKLLKIQIYLTDWHNLNLEERKTFLITQKQHLKL